MEGAYYFTYETVNFTKMKYYLGQHCTKDLNDGYFGSDKELKKDIKNGDEYETNIITHYNNIYDLGLAEYILIKERNASFDHDYYNPIRNSIYFNVNFEYGLNKLHKEKIGNSNRGKKQTPEHVENNRKAQIKWNCTHINKNVGLKRTEEQCNNMRHAHKPMSEQGRINLSISHIGKKHILKEVICPYCIAKGKGPNMARYHFNNCKLKNEQNNINRGS